MCVFVSISLGCVLHVNIIDVGGWVCVNIFLGCVLFVFVVVVCWCVWYITLGCALCVNTVVDRCYVCPLCSSLLGVHPLCFHHYGVLGVCVTLPLGVSYALTSLSSDVRFVFHDNIVVRCVVCLLFYCVHVSIDIGCVIFYIFCVCVKIIVLCLCVSLC